MDHKINNTLIIEFITIVDLSNYRGSISIIYLLNFLIAGTLWKKNNIF